MSKSIVDLLKKLYGGDQNDASNRMPLIHQLFYCKL